MTHITKTQRISALRALRYSIIDRPGAHIHTADWRGRCSYCGHRVAQCTSGPGAHIRQTREQPWRIPSEIAHRYLAMRKGQ